jgi:hypothetical protein
MKQHFAVVVRGEALAREGETEQGRDHISQLLLRERTRHTETGLQVCILGWGSRLIGSCHEFFPDSMNWP